MKNIFRNKKNLRRFLLGALVFLVAMAQNVPLLPGIYGVRPLPLLPLVIAISVLDQALPGVLFGAAAGLLWDISSPAAIPTRCTSPARPSCAPCSCATC